MFTHTMRQTVSYTPEACGHVWVEHVIYKLNSNWTDISECVAVQDEVLFSQAMCLHVSQDCLCMDLYLDLDMAPPLSLVFHFFPSGHSRRSIFSIDHHFKRDFCKTQTVNKVNYDSYYEILIHGFFIFVKLSPVVVTTDEGFIKLNKALFSL